MVIMAALASYLGMEYQATELSLNVFYFLFMLLVIFVCIIHKKDDENNK